MNKAFKKNKLTENEIRDNYRLWNIRMKLFDAWFAKYFSKGEL